MKYIKSKAAYTNKWLNRNKHLWEEKVEMGTRIIVLKIECAPKMIIDRVEEINHSRKSKTTDELINAIIHSIKWDKVSKRK